MLMYMHNIYTKNQKHMNHRKLNRNQVTERASERANNDSSNQPTNNIEHKQKEQTDSQLWIIPRYAISQNFAIIYGDCIGRKNVEKLQKQTSRSKELFNVHWEKFLITSFNCSQVLDFKDFEEVNGFESNWTTCWHLLERPRKTVSV